MIKHQPLRFLSPLFCLTIASLFYSSISVAESPLKHVVSAGANITEIVIALGAEKQLVAVDSTSDLPPRLKLPVVGYHRQLSAEALLALGLDGLIGSDEMGPESSLLQLQQAGIAVHRLNSEATIAGLEQRIVQLAELLGHPQQGQQLQAKLKQQISHLKQQAKTARQLNSLFFISHDGKKLMAAGDHTAANSIIELAGAVNLAKPHINSYKPLSNEAILALQPELLLFSQRSLDALGGPQGVIDSFPVLAATPAGQQLAIYAIDGHALIGGLGLASLEQATRLSQRLQ
ncbi:MULTISPECIES: heme/hemin ABC transporter substrate-binding protein [unclassified Agarivorans]|uniref:heme/hemin ABC transporter substrate-binding protein n=1 Tax=unclassified Agarivorans TaxID=2636026 RepID=UPI003D7E68EA